MKPEAVIFDMDDVLCRYDLGRRLRALARITGQMPRDIRAAIWDSGFEDAADTGAFPDPDDYLREFGKRIGFPLTRQHWVEARREAMQPWPDMLALARHIGTLRGALPLLRVRPEEARSQELPEADGPHGNGPSALLVHRRQEIERDRRAPRRLGRPSLCQP